MDIQYLKGIGEKRAVLFRKLGINTTEELLLHYPRRYEDRTAQKNIADLIAGETCCVVATVGSPLTVAHIRQGLDLAKTHVFDDTGALSLTFFNAPYVQNSLLQGETYIFYGKTAENAVYKAGSMRSGVLVMNNPICEPVEKSGNSTGRILPLYPLTSGLNQGQVRNAVQQVLEKLPDDMEDVLPDDLRKQSGLCYVNFALNNIHFPQSYEELDIARRRLVYEELLVLQLGLLRLKNRRTKAKGRKFEPISIDDFYERLPFKLTLDQLGAISDCVKDMESGSLCHRLIQGDVGSGKTLVAAAVAVHAIRNGYQAALMAPTEILAEQHANTLAGLLEPLGITVALLVGRLTQGQKRKVRARIAEGGADFIIGTHALLSQGVEFARLGLIITDEQHRFGVRQQEALVAKGRDESLSPHRIVMSATPIPRTLGLILYGDMDVTIMKGMPPGRKPIKTFVVDEGMRGRINSFIKKLVGEGRQVYIVCPMIDENEEEGQETSVASVIDYAETLSAAFKDLRIGLLHGKMKGDKKEAVMREYSQGNLDILVATTVIEVGVNVPNAALMIVENAERFGLSQLHQLRGRVGRGEYESFCVLFLQSQNETSRSRLNTMQAYNDGFAIAEADLALRGPGDFFGERQHGLPAFVLADLSSDMQLLEQTRADARSVLEEDGELTMSKNRGLKNRVDHLMSRLDAGG